MPEEKANGLSAPAREAAKEIMQGRFHPDPFVGMQQRARIIDRAMGAAIRELQTDWDILVLRCFKHVDPIDMEGEYTIGQVTECLDEDERAQDSYILQLQAENKSMRKALKKIWASETGKGE